MQRRLEQHIFKYYALELLSVTLLVRAVPWFVKYDDFDSCRLRDGEALFVRQLRWTENDTARASIRSARALSVELRGRGDLKRQPCV
jgi:hypothetical protein